MQTKNVLLVQNTSNQTLKLTHLPAFESAWPCNKATIEGLILYCHEN